MGRVLPRHTQPWYFSIGVSLSLYRLPLQCLLPFGTIELSRSWLRAINTRRGSDPRQALWRQLRSHVPTTFFFIESIYDAAANLGVPALGEHGYLRATHAPAMRNWVATVLAKTDVCQGGNTPMLLAASPVHRERHAGRHPRDQPGQASGSVELHGLPAGKETYGSPERRARSDRRVHPYLPCTPRADVAVRLPSSQQPVLIV
jgi:hypothetical protein